MAHNISFIQGYRDIKNVDGFIEMESSDIQDLMYEFLKRIVDDKRSVRRISSKFDNDMNIPIGCGLSIYKYLLINKIIEIDMLQEIDVNNIIQILLVNNEQIKKVQAI